MSGDRDVVDSCFNEAAGRGIEGVDAKLNGLPGPGIEIDGARGPGGRDVARSAGSRIHGLNDAVLTDDAHAEQVR